MAASKFRHQKKHYPKTTINVDTSITGSGGVAVSLGPVDPGKSEEAWERACEEAQSHEDRVVLAYKYLSEGTAVRNDDFLTPDATIPYTMKGQPAKLANSRAKPAPAPIAKKKRKPQPDNSARELQELRHEIAQLKKASQNPRRLEKKKPAPRVVSFEDENRAFQEEMQREMEVDSFQERVMTNVKQAATAKRYTEQEAVDAIKKGFGTLAIPNLGPTANKPTFRVQFDLGSIGKQEAWYHWVSEHEGGLFLIYDTRFEYGIRYSPPKTGLDNTITVILPDHGKTYTVHSIDLVHPFGVFSITNLLHASKATIIPPDHGVFGYGPPKISEVAEYMLGDKEDDDGEEWRDPRGYYTSGEQGLQNQLRL
jgi:hypothetical protein